MAEFKKVDPKQNFPHLEETITKFWKEHKIFEKSVEERDASDKYVFYDGPPFITGTPHYGSLLPSIAKDVVPRYWTMNGKRVERVWGWDCHGLPIENKVENKLGLKNRREIEKMGIQKFVDECYAYTTQTSAEWEWYIDKIGRWVDFDNAYKTMDQDYMESVIWVFSELWKRKLVYEGVRVSLYCTRCGTPISNFEIAMDDSYEDMEDPAVTVKFEIEDAEEEDLKGAKILAWTTTPWTLPSNRALVVDENEDYLVVEHSRKVEEREGVGAVIIDREKNKALVMRDKQGIGYLLAGGKEGTESDEEALKREISEESGYQNVRVVAKLGRGTHYSPMMEKIVKKNYNYYLVELEDGQKVKPVGGEEMPKDVVWVDLANLENALTFPVGKVFAQLADKFDKDGKIEETTFEEESSFKGSTEKVAELVEKLIVAKKRAPFVFNSEDGKNLPTNFTIRREFKGKELVGLSYKPLFTYFKPNDKDLKVYSYKGMVHMEEGTGIVHSAPGFGEIDTQMGNEVGLTTMFAVNDEGKFIDKVEDYRGIYIKKADPMIIADLNRENMLFKAERIVHRYPYCYRCHTPLIQKAQDSWFLRVSQLKELMVKTNENINWVPDHLKHGRFLKGIETAPDWCISRTRYWATPMPVWKCTNDDCDHVDVFSSRKEIEEASGQKVVDLHRPKIDAITYPCKVCGEGEMKRVPEVLDVWMDSGSMPYAQKHYPFENKEDFEANYPADFIVEYIAQTRAWFYVMHVISNALFETESFRNVITTGVIFGTDGRKMSKSYGNYPDPKGLLERYGAEPLRMYLMGSRIMVGEDINFSEEGLKDQLKSFILPLWNSYSFFVTYANMHNWSPKTLSMPKDPSNKLDAWIIAKLQMVTRNVRIAFEQYDIPAVVREYPEFMQDLSKWYIRRSRDRFNDGEVEALDTLYYVLVEFSKLLAPLMPFITEEIWQNLVVNKVEGAKESIHLSDYPKQGTNFMEKSDKLLMQMGAVREIVNLGQSIRVEQGIKVRQALSELEVRLNLEQKRDVELEEWMKELVKDELNVKVVDEDSHPAEVEGWVVKDLENGTIRVSLNTQITEELKREGIFRELARQIQAMRKKQNLNVDDKINLRLTTEDMPLLVVIDMYKEELTKSVNATNVEVKKGKPENALSINGMNVQLELY